MAVLCTPRGSASRSLVGKKQMFVPLSAAAKDKLRILYISSDVLDELGIGMNSEILHLRELVEEARKVLVWKGQGGKQEDERVVKGMEMFVSLHNCQAKACLALLDELFQAGGVDTPEQLREESDGEWPDKLRMQCVRAAAIRALDVTVQEVVGGTGVKGLWAEGAIEASFEDQRFRVAHVKEYLRGKGDWIWGDDGTRTETTMRRLIRRMHRCMAAGMEVCPEPAQVHQEVPAIRALGKWAEGDFNTAQERFAKVIRAFEQLGECEEYEDSDQEEENAKRQQQVGGGRLGIRR